MEIWDVSVGVSPRLPVWPGDPPVVVERYLWLSAGAAANVSRLSCSVHVGTHVDAPLHFVDGGAAVDQLPIEAMIGPVWVGGVPGVQAIEPAHLDLLGVPPGTQRLLLRTRNSELWGKGARAFEPNFAALTPEAAAWVVAHGICLVGVDYLSVQLFHAAEPRTHRILLEAGVVIVEGLNLSEVVPGPYQLLCLPMKLVGCDGAPARVLLVRER